VNSDSRTIETGTKVRIDEIEPPVHGAWATTSSNAPGGWEGTTITFDLRPEGSNTVLSFAHRGFEQANEGFERGDGGWGYYLDSLRYLETGEGKLLERD
jgi:hypothetical protein